MTRPTPTLEPVGLIGTGLFGTAVAERLLAAGYPTIVHNRTRSKTEPLIARGAKWSDNPLAECRRVIFCLFTVDQTEKTFLGMDAGRPADQIVIDSSTSDPEETASLGKRLAERGVHYLESPFSGSSDQMRNHQATALVGGEQTAFAQCDDLWQCLAAKTFYVGHWGSGAKMKLVTNLVLGLNRAALAEGLVFAETIGLTMLSALEVLLGSPAYSRIMDAKGPKMVNADFTPQARLAQHIKDVRLMLEAAKRNNTTLPLSATHLRLLERAESAGLGDLDNSAIIRVINDSKLNASDNS